jgi:hypothetical protein
LRTGAHEGDQEEIADAAIAAFDPRDSIQAACAAYMAALGHCGMQLLCDGSAVRNMDFLMAGKLLDQKLRMLERFECRRNRIKTEKAVSTMTRHMLGRL